jgi:Peptidase A4 family
MYQAGPSALRTGMSTRELPGGVTVHTFPSPPDGFNPLKADEKELLAYGYPSRPQDPVLAEGWERVLSRSMRPIQPTFRSMPYQRRPRPEATAGPAHDAAVSVNWSGAMVHAPDGDPFNWVQGRWTVPNAFPPQDALTGAWYSASTWIGIYGSSNVLRAGCDSDVMTSGGVIQRQLTPWWQLSPAEPFWISNLPVAQGDTMSCLIVVDPGSTTAATILMINATSGVQASFQATAPRGASNSAAWAVENPGFGPDAPVGLASFGDVYFAEASASTVADTVVKAGSGDIINMADESGAVISTGQIETQTLIQVRYTAP